MLAPPAKPDGVVPQMAELAFFNGDVQGVYGFEGSAHGHGSLSIRIALRVHGPIGVQKLQPAEGQVPRAVDVDQFRQPWRDELFPCHVLAGQGPVRDGTGRPVEPPLARRIERVRRILDVVAGVFLLVRGTRIGCQGGDADGFIHARNGHADVRPCQQRHHLRVRSRPLLPDIGAAKLQTEGLVLRTRPVDAVEAVVGGPRPLRPSSRYEKLAEWLPSGVRGPD